MINGVKTIGSLAAIGFLLALQPLAAQENFPEFDGLAGPDAGRRRSADM